jgi:predicted nucleic acid-binding protein
VLLDINVMSEFMRRRPSMTVVDRLNRQYRAELYVCAISLAEIEQALAPMPAGWR